MRWHGNNKIMEQRGVVLILSVLVMVALSVLGLAILMTAQTEDTIASNYRNHTQAFYTAEAGLEARLVDLWSLLTTTGTPTNGQLAILLSPALTDPSYSFNTFQVGRVRATQRYGYQAVIDSGPYQGLNALTNDYQITAEVSGPRGPIRSLLREGG